MSQVEYNGDTYTVIERNGELVLKPSISGRMTIARLAEKVEPGAELVIKLCVTVDDKDSSYRPLCFEFETDEYMPPEKMWFPDNIIVEVLEHES